MKKTKIYLSDIIANHPEKEYQELYDYLIQRIDRGELIPIKNAGVNGKKPALPNAFWRIEKAVDYSEVYDELNFKVHPLLRTEYYRQYPERYEQDKQNIYLLSDYLKNHSELLDISESMNERSFEIFKREKFFQKEGGLEFCKKLGISKQKLNYYETSEPLSYYSHSKQSPQNILIVENKDTFYDIRRYMNHGKNKILNKCFDTLIYGAGKGIYRSFYDYVNGAETYFNKKNHLYYFGDFDYEGILIYEHFVNMDWRNTETGAEIEIDLFVTAYEKMIDKAEKIGLANLPDTKINQNTNIGNKFLNYFNEQTRQQMRKILTAGKYIPQEILNEHDWG